MEVEVIRVVEVVRVALQKLVGVGKYPKLWPP